MPTETETVRLICTRCGNMHFLKVMGLDAARVPVEEKDLAHCSRCYPEADDVLTQHTSSIVSREN